MHEGQFRHSGEPYFTHPSLLPRFARTQLDDATIITALLHDTIEDTKAYYRVSELFGEEVAELVDGVTKLTNLQLSVPRNQTGRKFPQAVHGDVKGRAGHSGQAGGPPAQHAHDQIDAPGKTGPKARETMDIYAPLAGRMGMQWMREELEDLAFRVLNPKVVPVIIRRFITLQRETGDVIDRSPAICAGAGKGIDAEVLAGPRNPIRSGAKCRKRIRAFRVCRISTGFGYYRQRGGLLPRAWGDPPALACGAGAFQGLYQPAENQRVPSSTPPFRARWQTCRGADPHSPNA